MSPRQHPDDRRLQPLAVRTLAALLACALALLATGSGTASASGGESIVGLGAYFLPSGINSGGEVVGPEGQYWNGTTLKHLSLSSPFNQGESVAGIDDAGNAYGYACEEYQVPCRAFKWVKGATGALAFKAPRSPYPPEGEEPEAAEEGVEELKPATVDGAGEIAGLVSYGSVYTVETEEAWYYGGRSEPVVEGFYDTDGSGGRATRTGSRASDIVAISPSRSIAEQSTNEYENSLTYVELGPKGSGAPTATSFCVYEGTTPSMASDGAYTANQLIGTYEGFPDCAYGTKQPMLRLPSGTTTVLPLGGADAALANGVNASHEVVGTASVKHVEGSHETVESYAVIWPEGGSPIPLSTFLPEGSGWSSLSAAYAINNAGEVVGIGTHEGHSEDFILSTASGLAVTSLVLSPTHPTTETGQFTATMTVRNQSSSETVTDVTPSISSGDTAALAVGSPSPSTGASLGPGASTTFTYTLTPLEAKTVTITAKAAGKAESGESIVSHELTRSIDLAPGALGVSLAASPAIGELNKADTVTATITNKTGQALTNLRPRLTSTPSSGISIGAPSVATIASIEPHGVITVSWPVTGSVTGAYHLEAAVEATSAETGTETDAGTLELPIGVAVVEGVVHNSLTKPSQGVKLALTGTSDEGKAVSMSTTSNGSGSYSFAAPPGTYSVTASGEELGQNGGSVAVAVSPTSKQPVCAGSVEGATCKLGHLKIGESTVAGFTYTFCTAASRTPNGKPATGCPIVFIPGFLGTRIRCDSGELWFNALSYNPAYVTAGIDWADMNLDADGRSDVGTGGSCGATAQPVKGTAGVLTSAAGVDAYGSALEYLERIAPGRVYAYTYDWRRSPLEAEDGLNEEVEEILGQTGANRVVLLAHSMGGLVTQGYVADSDHAAKVERVATVGTPYWGAPKSHMALALAQTGGIQLEGLDVLAGGAQLQRAARNYTGLYWLYPSQSYGPWLDIEGPGWGGRSQGGTALDKWIAALKGTTALYNSAISGHASLDGFKTNGIPYEIMVGIGEPTITGMRISDNPMSATEEVEASYGSGDGTVPARSQTQGAFDTGKPLGDDVPVHYVCGVSHMGELASTEVQSRMENYLLEGEQIEGGQRAQPASCPYEGVASEVKTKVPASKAFAASAAASQKAPTIAIVSQGRTLSLAEAVGKELVTVNEAGGVTTVLTSAAKPAIVLASGKNLELNVQKLGSAGNGPMRHFGPVSGTVSITAAATATLKGKALRAQARAKRPTVSAKVSGCGKRLQVRLSARHAAAVYYRIAGHTKRYRRQLELSRAQLKKLVFSALGASGRWSVAHELALGVRSKRCSR